MVIVPEDQAGRTVAVGPADVVIGRDATCDLVLPSDQVSRQHAAVRRFGDGFLVEDLNSLNGTSLNGRTFTGAVMLRDGDRLTFADVEVEFRLTESQSVPPSRSQPPSGARWQPEAQTQSTGQVEAETSGEEKASLRRELHDAPGFSGTALLLTVAGSLVGTILVGFADVGPWGSLTGAAIAPVVTATFTTKRTGEKGRVRTWAIVILSAVALTITVTGVSAAELATDSRVTPGSGDAMTFTNADPESGLGGGGTWGDAQWFARRVADRHRLAGAVRAVDRGLPHCGLWHGATRDDVYVRPRSRVGRYRGPGDHGNRVGRKPG
jgi:hypothetical protein